MDEHVDDTDLQKSESSMTQNEAPAPAPFKKLSTDIIQRVQAALGQKEGARSALISKWYELAWSTRSALDFNDVECGGCSTAVQVLTRYGYDDLRVETFKLWSQEISHADASFCISAAVNLGAQNLSIFVGPECSDKFVVPEDVLRSPYLQTLCVVGCIMDFRGEVNCTHLKHLQLTELGTYGDILDDLVLKRTTLEKLEIGNTEKLTQETKALSPNWENQIAKSRLQSLDLVGVDSLENITRWDIWVRFPLLKSVEILDIHSRFNWDGLSICSSSLQEITLNLHASQLSYANFELPNLQEFKLVAKSTPRVGSFKTNSHWVCNLEIQCSEGSSLEWYINLRNLLRKVSSADVHLTINLAFEDAPAPLVGDDLTAAQTQQDIPQVQVLDILARKEELILGFLPSLGWYCKPTKLCLGGQTRPDLLQLLHHIQPSYVPTYLPAQ